MRLRVTTLPVAGAVALPTVVLPLRYRFHLRFYTFLHCRCRCSAAILIYRYVTAFHRVLITVYCRSLPATVRFLFDYARPTGLLFCVVPFTGFSVLIAGYLPATLRFYRMIARLLQAFTARYSTPLPQFITVLRSVLHPTDYCHYAHAALRLRGPLRAVTAPTDYLYVCPSAHFTCIPYHPCYPFRLPLPQLHLLPHVCVSRS